MENYNFQAGELANLIELYYKNPRAFNDAYLRSLVNLYVFDETVLCSYFEERLDNLN